MRLSNFFVRCGFSLFGLSSKKTKGKGKREKQKIVEWSSIMSGSGYTVEDWICGLS
jgi:hypothetical protein